jgi:hypothetical protein
MRPLNEYPKEELEDLLQELESVGLSNSNEIWVERVKQAISDQEFSEKELPFKTE